MSRMRQQGRGSRLPAPWMLRCWWQTTNTAGSGRDSSGPPRPQPPTGCQQNTPKIGSSPWRSPRLGGGTGVQYNRERCTHAPNSIAHRTAMHHRVGLWGIAAATASTTTPTKTSTAATAAPAPALPPPPPPSPAPDARSLSNYPIWTAPAGQ